MYSKIIISVDPAVTNKKNSDETGIIVAGKALDKAYILEDLSLKAAPHEWATVAINAYHTYAADYVLVETNQGGDLVESLIKTIDPKVRIKSVRASISKRARAEPIAQLYRQGKVFHTKVFPILEKQLCAFVPRETKSPDRMDALVWAIHDLLPPNKKSPGFWAFEV